MSHGGRDFETALTELAKLGYTCDALIINAAHFVPQSRPRLFVVAKQLAAGDKRNADVTVSELRPEPLANFISLHPRIPWDIRRLPQLPTVCHHLDDVIEDLPDDDPHWWDRQRVEYFVGQLSERHLVEAKKMIAGRRFTYATAFRRVRKGRSMAELRTDGIAGCLRTPRGGSGRQIVFKGGRGKYAVRLMTARECARLQGVPDQFRVDAVPLNQALFGFGDAVCVPVVEWIAEHYLTPVASEMLRSRLLEPTLFS